MNYLAGQLREAVRVGHPDPTGFVGFAMRYLFLCIPAILFGHLIDQSVQHAQASEWLGGMPAVYLVLQTVLWLVFFYIVVRYFPNYAWEFQSTYAGLAFGTLFFTVQDNYVENLQRTLVITNKIVTVRKE